MTKPDPIEIIYRRKQQIGPVAVTFTVGKVHPTPAKPKEPKA
jgi:hypothetical protein